MRLFVCKNLGWEVARAADAEGLAHLEVISLPSCSDACKPELGRCKETQPPANGATGRDLLMACPYQKSAHGQSLDDNCLLPLSQCFDAVIGPDAVGRYMNEGVHLLLPAMLSDWRQRALEWGFEAGSDDNFFKDTTRKFVLLDTGNEQADLSELKALSVHTGIPCESVPVSLDYLRLYLARHTAERNPQREGTDGDSRLKQRLRNAANLAMALDLIEGLVSRRDRKQAIAGILEMCQLLFGPRMVYFHAPTKGGSSKFFSSDSAPIPSGKRKTLKRFLDHDGWIPELEGFAFPLVFGGQVTGTVIVQEIHNPAYFDSYAETARTIAPILGLALENASAFSSESALRKTTETARRHFKRLFDLAPLAYQSLDGNGRFLDVNRAWLEMLGYTRDEVIGREFEDFLVQEGFLESNFPRFLKQGKARFPLTEIRCKDGSVKVVHIDGRIGYEGHQGCLQTHCILSDVTARAKAEQALRDSQEQVNRILESVGEGIYGVDESGHITFINPAGAKMLGYQTEDLLGEHPHFAIHHTRSDGTPYLPDSCHICASLRDGVAHSVDDDVFWRKDGSSFPVDYTTTPITAGDKSTGAVVVFRDITRRKLLMEELDQHRNHLEQLVEVRTEQLSKAQRKAEAANLSKSLFLSNMSHEIRTPMNAIIGLTHLLQEGNARPEQAELLDKIGSSANHMLAILNDIIDLSKIEAGKVSLEQIDFQPATVLDNVQSMLEEIAKEKNLEISVANTALPTWLKGDPTRLRQALLNLASNAVKFTERGGITIRAVKLQENDEGVLLRFEVEDTGIGIPKDKLKSIFNSFEQADPSITRIHGGTGLGLAITRKLSKLMGGQTGVESTLGRGSTFWFTARFARGQGSACDLGKVNLQNVEHALATYHRGSRILVVEDNVINLMVMQQLLTGKNLVVESAENGQEAVDKVCCNEYDLVLMDMQMPVMDGLEATRQIRAMDGKEDLPIIAITANTFEEDRKACIKAGMDDFLAKPIKPLSLYLLIENWLSKTKAPPCSDASLCASPQSAA